MILDKLKKASDYLNNNMCEEMHIIKNVLDERISKEEKNELHKKLSQYRNLKREVNELEEKYNKLFNSATKVTAVNGDGIHSSGTSDKVGLASEMAEYKEQIEKNINIINNEIAKIEKFVMEIDDAEIREIIRYRFLDGMSWNQVAFKIESYNECVPRNKYTRWLNRL